jgi:hypothetical protein
MFRPNLLLGMKQSNRFAAFRLDGSLAIANLSL